MRRCLAFFLALALGAQDVSKLPEWARSHAEAGARETPPTEADAWVLLDRTEIAYAGDGEIQMRRLRLVKILGERGLGQGSFMLHGLGGRASKVKRVKGWNLRPDSDLEKLDQDSVVTIDSDGDGAISTDVITAAALQRVVKGSLVAFESLQVVRHPMGPAEQAFILEAYPIRRWELETAKREGWFTNLKQVAVQMDFAHFAPWIPHPEFVAGQRVAASNLPALPRDERLHPNERDMLPRVEIRFQDPDLKSAPGLRSWNEIAVWTHGNYVRGPLGPTAADPLAVLRATHGWLCREFSYRQVYLRPERGWIPEKPEEVSRKRYGDCKDLAGWVIQQARDKGLEAFAVLARIHEGGIPEDEPPAPMAFNHAIAAIRLDKSLGFPAEVEAGGRRFLLVDATDRLTPLGQLNVAHLGRRVMIATGVEALWVKVPDAAILRPLTEVQLEGQITEQGALVANLTLLETGNAMGLRGALLQSGPSGLRDHLLKEVLDLPPTGKLELERQGDPLESDQPLEIVLKLTNPEGFRANAGEWTLAPMGLFPQPGSPLTRTGAVRTFPLESRASGVLRIRAKLKMPFLVQPVLGRLAFDSAFRRLDFQASAIQENGFPRLDLRFSQERHPAFYGTGQLEKGVADWKKDRGQVRTLVTDGLAFKRLP